MFAKIYTHRAPSIACPVSRTDIWAVNSLGASSRGDDFFGVGSLALQQAWNPRLGAGQISRNRSVVAVVLFLPCAPFRKYGMSRVDYPQDRFKYRGPLAKVTTGDLV